MYWRYLLLLVMNLPGLSAAEPINFGVQTGLPNEYFQQDIAPRGVLPEILNQVFQPRGVEIDFELMPRRRLIHKIQAGEVALAMLPVIPRYWREQAVPEGVLIGKEPFLSFEINLYTLASRKVVVRQKSDLAQYRIGIVRQPKFMEHALDDIIHNGSHLEQYNKPEQLFKALSSGRVDLILSSEPLKNGMLRQLAIHEPLEPVYRVGRAGMYLVFSTIALGGKVTELKSYSDTQILQMHKQGQIQAITERFGVKDWFYFSEG